MKTNNSRQSHSQVIVAFGILALGLVLAGCPKEFSYHPEDPNAENKDFVPSTQTPTVTLTPTPLRKRVFTTSTTYDGKFNDAVGGILKADQRCQERADAAVLGGTWVALISDVANNAIDRISNVGPWYRLDRVNIVFNGKTGGPGSIDSGPLIAMNKDEFDGVIVAAPFFVWTGSDVNAMKGAGPANSEWCANWGDDTFSGIHGDLTLLTGAWIRNGGSQGCTVASRIYCFEK